MNKVILCGRLVKDPELRQGNTVSARYTIAVDRQAKNADQNADFISCVTFGNNANFAEKYLHKGSKILVEGRIQTGSYTNKDGQKVYTTDVIVDRHEFCEGRANGSTTETAPTPALVEKGTDGFMSIPDGVEDTGLPFS